MNTKAFSYFYYIIDITRRVTMIKEDNSDENEKNRIEAAAILKNIINEAKRRPDLLAALIVSWLDEDTEIKTKK